MGIYQGTSPLDVYIGNNKVQAVYQGDTLIKDYRFIFTIDTTMGGYVPDGKMYAFKMTEEIPFNFTVAWGDGTVETYSDYTDVAPLIHTYPSAGIYDIALLGSIKGINFREQESALYITNIKNWGCFEFMDVASGYTSPSIFNNAWMMAITATDAPKIGNSLQGAFESCSSLYDIPNLANWDFSRTTTIKAMFKFCDSFNGSVSGIDVSKVTDFSEMFYGCTSFNQPVSTWDTSSLTTMSSMFSSASSFNQVFGGLNVTNIAVVSIGLYSACPISRENYDASLILLAAQNVGQAKRLTMKSTTKYTLGGAAQAARTHLVSVHGWTIIDGGGI